MNTQEKSLHINNMLLSSGEEVPKVLRRLRLTERSKKRSPHYTHAYLISYMIDTSGEGEGKYQVY